MLINALCEYADLKEASRIPEGWSEQDIHYNIILSPDGELLEIVDIREEVRIFDKKGKEEVSFKPKKSVLPKRTQKSGIDSNYIEHRPLYIFGLNYDKESGKFTPHDKTNKAQKSHAAFVEHELEFMNGLSSEICTAYRLFIEKWQPENETENEVLKKLGKDISNSYFTFSLGIGEPKLEEDPQVKEKYMRIFSEKSAESNNAGTAVCGILGEKLPMARLHDKIKFPGGQSSGCQLICMNNTAFESYGKTQSYNSNVSETAMKKYTSMFNYLLSDKGHHFTLGDMTVIFFAMKENDSPECDLLFRKINGSHDEKSVDGETEQGLEQVIKYARNGFTTDEESLSVVDENVIFYIAGFTPNSSRICQKFIWRNRYGDIIRNLQKHREDLRIKENSMKPVYFRDIAKELVLPDSSKDKVPPPLMTNIMFSAFNATKYPDGMLSTIIRRIKTDRDDEKNHFIKLNDIRAGMIKACLNRKYKKEEITMSWNENNNNPAYLCGGLFAVYEKIQQDSSDGALNKTIKDSYFSSACSRPASVFPKLAMLANIHMRKLNVNHVIYYNKIIQKVVDGLDGEFPQMLGLDDQGRFIVGYYQMNQKLYTSNKSE
jgi:CRISPR-associated protein, csd1 family